MAAKKGNSMIMSMLQSIALALIYITAITSGSVNAQLACDSAGTSLTSATGKWCVAGVGDGKGNAIFTLYAAQKGWLGFAANANGMMGADMVIGFLGTDGKTVTIQSFLGVGDVTPNMNNNPTWTQVDFTGTPPAWANIIYSAKRSTSGLPQSGKLNFILGWSDTPSTPNNFRQHDDFASKSVPDVTAFINAPPVVTPGPGNNGTNTNTTTNPNPTPIVAVDAGPTAILTGMSAATVNLIHGALMFVAWAVCPYVGIFIARYLKDVLGVWWYRLHLGIMLGGCGVLSLVGMLIRILYKVPPHFDSIHQQIGLGVEILMILQIILGFISNAMWTPDRTSIPWWDHLHWWIGRTVFAFGIISIYLGFREYDMVMVDGVSPLLVVLFWTWCGAGLVALVAGQFKYGQVHHVNGHVGPSELEMKNIDNSTFPRGGKPTSMDNSSGPRGYGGGGNEYGNNQSAYGGYKGGNNNNANNNNSNNNNQGGYGGSAYGGNNNYGNNNYGNNNNYAGKNNNGGNNYNGNYYGSLPRNNNNNNNNNNYNRQY